MDLSNAPVVPVPPFAFVAPLGTQSSRAPWEGRLPKRPWHFKVTVAIPHLDTPETLPSIIELFRWQTERPYILIMDTGSYPACVDILEQLRGPDVEIHYLKGGGYCNSSEPVSIAMDCALALCRTPYLFATHADCFVRRRDLLQWYLGQCNPECPLVGYEMSPRQGTSQWRGTPSHTATMMHVPTLRAHGVRFNLLDAYRMLGLLNDDTPPNLWPRTRGWPDTETSVGLTLKAKGINYKLLGVHDQPEDRTYPYCRPESNYERHIDDNIDHVRSYPSAKMFSNGYKRKAEPWMAQAIAEAQQRCERWSKGLE